MTEQRQTGAALRCSHSHQSVLYITSPLLIATGNTMTLESAKQVRSSKIWICFLLNLGWLGGAGRIRLSCGQRSLPASHFAVERVRRSQGKLSPARVENCTEPRPRTGPGYLPFSFSHLTAHLQPERVVTKHEIVGAGGTTICTISI